MPEIGQRKARSDEASCTLPRRREYNRYYSRKQKRMAGSGKHNKKDPAKEGREETKKRRKRRYARQK